MKKNNLAQLQYELFKTSQAQRNQAWYEKDYNKAQKLRKEEQKTYEKSKLLEGIRKAQEKQERGK